MNRFQSKQRKHPLLRQLLLSLCVFLLLLFCFIYGLNAISSQSEAEQQKALENSIRQSAVHCYATEGNYPESLSYLEEHYGITYDHSKYVVDYEIFGSNLMPQITVIPLQKKEGTP